MAGATISAHLKTSAHLSTRILSELTEYWIIFKTDNLKKYLMKSATWPQACFQRAFIFFLATEGHFQFKQIFRESQSVMDFRKASMSLKWNCTHRSFAEKKKGGVGFNLQKYILFSCTSDLGVFNPAEKHITSQFQLNGLQSKMIFNRNKISGAEPITLFCWFHIPKCFSIVIENVSKLF